MQVVSDILLRLQVGKETEYKNLAVFPLFNEGAYQPEYLTLDEALAAQAARITEMPDGGSVPELRFVNQSNQPILLLDGEELVGAMQNRVLNLTVLAPARSTLTIPVTCVEQGRWVHQSDAFAAASRAQYAEGRAKRMAQVTEALRLTGRRASNQQAVWDDIARKSEQMAARSSTQAMAAIYDKHAETLEKFVCAFQVSDQQVGGLFAINGRCVGCDIFDSSITLRKLLPKLVRSYAADAIAPDAPKPVLPSHWSAEAWLRAISSADMEIYPSIGLGQDVRFQGTSLTGAALMMDGRIVHLSAHCQELNISDIMRRA